jgi:ascorbate-specific PTS system EIIC-type component UlaA
VTNGLILLGFIALLVALVIARIRRRIGLAVTGRVLLVTATCFAIAVLALWATSRGSRP